MGRREAPLDPDEGPVQAFAHELRELRRGAGNPPYRALAAKAYCSASALASAAGGKELPSLNVTLAYVRACGGDEAVWERRWRELNVQVARPPAPVRPVEDRVPRTRVPGTRVPGTRVRWIGLAVVLVVVVAGLVLLRGGGAVEPVELIPLAGTASWRSGQGPVAWGSGSRVQAGAVNLSLQAPMESGVRVERVLGTHPEWVPHGYLEGDFTLPRPIHENDHFVASVGFYVDEPGFATGDRVGGEVDFSVYVLDEGGPRRVALVRDVGNDWRTPRLDVDLSPYEGATSLRIRVDAGDTAAQDWAGWWDMRLEPRP
ncbi:hypothetical protein ABGB17_35330 [Sphaerisporangium sp. B11E5]|uniref:hypothetical protein n=1 Tax=Sphaerisporangium sp. B11E5 TaxID=3153563 RepID=UPI00325D67EC